MATPLRATPGGGTQLPMPANGNSRGSGQWRGSLGVAPKAAGGAWDAAAGKTWNGQVGGMLKPKGGGAATQAALPDPHAGGPDTYGTQSGPTAVEDRYYQRANGTDPSWEYGIGRAGDSINRQYAARGGYNSSGAMQSLSDMYSNAVSQREGQLDTLSGAATSAHQNQLNSMFNNGLGIANGAAGTASGYDKEAGSAMSSANTDQISILLERANVDPKTRAAILKTIGDLGGAAASAAGRA